MGTRADFYVGKGDTAEWIGSIAWDGYRSGVDDAVLHAPTEGLYRDAVHTFLTGRDDGTLPEKGWPWPWDDSGTSDCSYWFFDGKCWDALGHPVEFYCSCLADEPDQDADNWHAGLEQVIFPNMAHLKNVTIGKRSGIVLIGRA